MTKKPFGMILGLALASSSILANAADYSEIQKEVETKALEQLMLNADKVSISNLGDLNALSETDAAAFANYKGKAFSYILASEITQDTVACPAGSPATDECLKRSSFSVSCYPQNEDAVAAAEEKALDDKVKELSITAECRLSKLTVTTRETFASKKSSKRVTQVLSKVEGERHGEFAVDVTLAVNNHENAEKPAALTKDLVKAVKLTNDSIRIGFKK